MWTATESTWWSLNEQVVSKSWLLGRVTVVGDFNPHIGGGECSGEQNLQGGLLQEVLERCELSAVSQSALTSGPAAAPTFCVVGM